MSFRDRLSQVLRSFGSDRVVVIKGLPFSDKVVTHVPGYCWSLDGAMKIYGDEDNLCWPYKSQSLYGMIVDVNHLTKWPFQWSWSDMKGFTGQPAVLYRPDQVKQFIKQTQTNEDLVALDTTLGNNNRDPKEIARDVVKSVKPGLVLNHDDTYTGNFEVIINVPVRMYCLAAGRPDDLYDTDCVLFDTKQIMQNSGMISRPSI